MDIACVSRVSWTKSSPSLHLIDLFAEEKEGKNGGSLSSSKSLIRLSVFVRICLSL